MRHRETEVKIRIEDAPAARRRLRELGFRPRHRRSLEDNTLFDTPERSLRQLRSILRLRHYGNRWFVTYKSTPDPDPHFKTRLEFETEIQHPRVIGSIFEALGLKPVFRYQKYRTVYAQARQPRSRNVSGEAALDQTPIGDFLELEGSRSWIDRVARRLGFSRSHYSTASYGALYLEDCRKKKISPGNMLFPTVPRQNKAGKGENIASQRKTS